MLDDLRSAFRSFRASPTFTAVGLIVLALGIGAGTAIFSVVDAVVLRGLRFDQRDRLVAVLEHDTRRPQTFGGGSTTPQMFLFETEPNDPWILIGALVTLTLAGLLASTVPARRAASVDPLVALRHE